MARIRQDAKYGKWKPRVNKDYLFWVSNKIMRKKKYIYIVKSIKS